MTLVIIKMLTSGKRLQRTYPPFIMCWSLLLGIFLLFLQSVNSQETNINGTKSSITTNLDRLRLQLFANYDKNSHPTYHNMPANITLGMSVLYVDIDEINGKFILHSWLRMNAYNNNVGEKKNRLPNFTGAEESILLTLVERFAHKIENKRTDAVSWEEKRKTWEEIAIKFESQTGVRRGSKNLREKYDTLKKNTRKNLSEEKKEVYKTGGGKFDYRVDERTNRIAAILGQSATGLENDVDSDAKDTSEKEAENLDASMASGTAERLDESYEAKENKWWDEDERSSWNVTEFNITQLHVKPKEVWTPEITLFNSAGEKSDYLGDTQVLWSHDGGFLWVPPAVYTAYCSLNFRNWPYDTQVCKVKIGSLALTYINETHLELEQSLDYMDLVQSTEWDIIGTERAYRRQDYYNYVEFTFKLKRRSSMYGAVIFTPASCIILLALSSFWLPPQMGEKIMLNGVVIVLIAAFLMYFAQLLPILADNTPLVVLFYSNSLLLLSISTIIAVCVLYLATAKHKRHLPEILKTLLNGPLSKVLLLENFALEADSHVTMNNGTKELVEHQYENPDGITDVSGINASTSASSNRFIQFEWMLLATAIDRIAFICYSISFIFFAILFAI